MNKDTMNVEKSLDSRILDVLEDVRPGGLSSESIAMIICLEDEISNLKLQIDTAESTIRLIKDKKIFVKYGGDKSQPVDLDQFEIILRRHDCAVKDLENMRFF